MPNLVAFAAPARRTCDAVRSCQTPIGDAVGKKITTIEGLSAKSDHPLQKAWKPAVTVVAPALGNAIFNAVGARVRSLPITADAVKAAMNA
jgi:CO/xanthine dehydrogenase Mo-binding subunit